MMDHTNLPAPRVPISVSVEFRRSYARKELTAIIRNLSITGALLEPTDDAWTKDILAQDKLFVRLNLAGRRRLLPATVVWRNDRVLGLRFQPESRQDVQLLDDLLYFAHNSASDSREVLESIFRQVG